MLHKCLSGEGCKPISQEGARALRQKMNREYMTMKKAICEDDIPKVKKMVADDAPFAGLLRWLLKNEHPGLFKLTCQQTAE